MNRLRRVCVYSGSSDSVGAVYLQAARAMGEALADHGMTVVFGGGRTGMMGALADAALARGGQVIGVMPREFNTEVLAHAGLTEMQVVETMHERKARMAEMADAFVA
ncbi:MAG: TIGR00730 family Rossman fold protein, partial [Anaerolineales bacterium]